MWLWGGSTGGRGWQPVEPRAAAALWGSAVSSDRWCLCELLSKWPAREITGCRRTHALLLHSTQRCCDTAFSRRSSGESGLLPASQPPPGDTRTRREYRCIGSFNVGGTGGVVLPWFIYNKKKKEKPMACLVLPVPGCCSGDDGHHFKTGVMVIEGTIGECVALGGEQGCTRVEQNGNVASHTHEAAAWVAYYVLGVLVFLSDHCEVKLVTPMFMCCHVTHLLSQWLVGC